MGRIKLFTGLSIVAVCVAIFIIIFCIRVFRIKVPSAFSDNTTEILILLAVSMIMGFVLMLS